MNFKTLGIVVAVAAVVGALAYNMGAKQSAEPAAVPVSAAPPSAPVAAPPAPMAAPSSMAQPHSAMPAGHGSYERFTHFNVGNRNVKSIYTDGDIAWIGSSGGVIEYNTRTDQHTYTTSFQKTVTTT